MNCESMFFECETVSLQVLPRPLMLFDFEEINVQQYRNAVKLHVLFRMFCRMQHVISV
jgi:hypothetical protein